MERHFLLLLFTHIARLTYETKQQQQRNARMFNAHINVA